MKIWLCLLTLCLLSCGRHESSRLDLMPEQGGTVVEKPTTPEDRLLEAARKGSVPEVQALQAEGVSLDLILPRGRSALIEAVLWSRVELVAWLLEQGVNRDLRDEQGQRAEDYAAEKPSLLRLFRPEQADEELTAFFAAIAANRFNEVKKFLQEGVDPNVENPDGETALTLAIGLKLDLVVRVLLQPGTNTDVEKPNRAGETPLALARRLGLSRIEQMLKQRGAQKSARGLVFEP